MSQSGCRHTCAGTCRHVSTPGNMPTCADMCGHMPTCDITFGPYDTNDLDLICMLTYVSTCGHADMCWYVPTCADMCRHVSILPTCNVSITLGTPDTNHLDRICTLAGVSTCGHAGMCWYVPTCADMCRHVLICSHMCQHVTSPSAPMIPIISTLSAFYYSYVSAHVDMPTCADMCRYVPTCSITLGISDTNHFDLISMLARVSTCGHADMCRHVTSF